MATAKSKCWYKWQSRKKTLSGRKCYDLNFTRSEFRDAKRTTLSNPWNKCPVIVLPHEQHLCRRRVDLQNPHPLQNSQGSREYSANSSQAAKRSPSPHTLNQHNLIESECRKHQNPELAKTSQTPHLWHSPPHEITEYSKRKSLKPTPFHETGPSSVARPVPKLR